MTLIKRSVMTLYSGPQDIYSHQVRIVLAEKGVNVNILTIDENHPNEDLAELNPYNTLPTLADRELVLFNARIIMEYLDERFPYPPLLPVNPVDRAKNRLTMYRIDRDWYSLYHRITANPDSEDANKARAELKEFFVSHAPLFEHMPYFLSEEFTLIDCCIAPLLWRLNALDIEIPKSAKAIHKYMDRVFARDSFQVSLTEVEREIREHYDIK